MVAVFGDEFGDDLLDRLSPYRTEHLNRFGEYHLNLSREIPEPDVEFEVLPSKFVKDG